MMRRLLRLTFLAVVGGSCALAATTPSARDAVAARLRALDAQHPRLFLSGPAGVALQQRIASNPLLQQVSGAVLAEADRELATTPVERVLIGRRLLDKSRTALGRVLNLGLAWRLSGNAAYLERGRRELLAVADFADWNPSHFLDVAEMTTAVAIGYDWFYPALDAETRNRLRTAIVEKGLKPSLKANSWSRVTNNWNQVCNGGMAIGALAVAESEPQLALDMIARAVDSVPLAMHEYAPDGAYPEGPSYWSYGTTYNVLLISALEAALGSDFGLAAQPGFLATADYYLHVIGPSGLPFNYSDAGRGGDSVAPAMFWFAARRGEPYLLWHERAKLEARFAAKSNRSRGYTDALVLLWSGGSLARPSTPPVLAWRGGGPMPVAFHRTSWDRTASFVAIKGGSASVNHAHMDVGAFVMDADGVRWADDLGMQDYNSLETKGINLWGRTQDAERWNVFRLGTSSHNVLQVDGQQQRVAGRSEIVKSNATSTVVNLTEIYAGQLASAQRGVRLLPSGAVRVQDEFTATERSPRVRWAMVTRAEAAFPSAGTAVLTQAGKQLTLRVLEPAGAALTLYPTDPPPAATDARNEGTRMVGFEVTVPAGAAQRIVVQLLPAAASAEAAPVTPLAAW